MDALILPNMSIDEVTSRYPQTAEVFVQHRMACVGCSLGPFHTVAEVAAIYHLAVEAFIEQLNARIDPATPEDVAG